MTLLQVDGLKKSFGGIVAVQDVTFTVEPQEIVGVIGPNGAGKTTTFRLLTGFETPDTGTVELQGEDVTDLTADQRARRGMVRTF